MKRKPKPKPEVEETRRFARSEDNILLAMGTYPTREMKARLRMWMAWPDFPKKTRNGWPIEELLAWVERNAEQFVKEGKLKKILERGEDVTGADLKLFRTPGAKKFTADTGEEFPEMVSGMDNLGKFIMQRFREFPQLGEVGRQRIMGWKQYRGIARRPGLQPFPVPTERNDYKLVDVFEWVAKWVIPDLPKLAGDLLGDNVDWGRALQKLEFENRTIEQNQLKGRLMEKAEHNRELEAIGKAYAQQLWEVFDEQCYLDVDAELTRRGVPEEARVASVTVLRELIPGYIREHQQWLEGRCEEGKAGEGGSDGVGE